MEFALASSLGDVGAMESFGGGVVVGCWVCVAYSIGQKDRLGLALGLEQLLSWYKRSGRHKSRLKQLLQM